MNVHSYEEINSAYYDSHGRNFVEDLEPSPICFYQRDPVTGQCKIDKMRSVVPKGAYTNIGSEDAVKMT